MKADLLRLAVEEAEHLFDLADAERDRHPYRSQAWWDAQAAASKAFVQMHTAQSIFYAETGLVA